MAGINISDLLAGLGGSQIARATRVQLSASNLVRENQLGTLRKENSALSKFNSLLIGVSDTLAGLRGLAGGAGGKTATSSESSIAEVSVDRSSSNQMLDVNVTSVAKAGSGSFGRSFSSGRSYILSDSSKSGTVEFAIGKGSAEKKISVAVNTSTTADSFVKEFNARADGKASARLVNTGSTQAPRFTIAIVATNEGEEKGSFAVSASKTELLGSDVLGPITIENAQNSKFTIDGVAEPFERQTNLAHDAVAGTSIRIKKEGQTRITIRDDEKITSSQIQKFVDSYNALARYQRAEDKTVVVEKSGGRQNKSGELAKTSIDDEALRDLQSALRDTRSGDRSRSLASLGVKTGADGTLTFDENKFHEAYAADPEAANSVVTALADSIAGPRGVVSHYTARSASIDQEVQSNNRQIQSIEAAVAQVERTAESQEQATLKQFNSLETLMTKLTADSNFISSLLMSF